MSELVGVLALQGDFAKHLDSLSAIGVEGREVRTPEDLADCSRLIIPGGESTTLGILIRSSGLDKAISEKVNAGMPIWGTCMGMILMAKDVEDYKQFSFGLMDITVRRNAFGAQVFSFEEDLEFKGLDSFLHAVFIRAPIVSKKAESVEELAAINDKIVAVRQGRLLGTSFHPELTPDTRVHQYFLSL